MKYEFHRETVNKNNNDDEEEEDYSYISCILMSTCI